MSFVLQCVCVCVAASCEPPRIRPPLYIKTIKEIIWLNEDPNSTIVNIKHVQAHSLPYLALSNPMLFVP